MRPAIAMATDLRSKVIDMRDPEISTAPKEGKIIFCMGSAKQIPEKSKKALSRHEVLEKLENIRHSVSDLKTFEPELLSYFRSQCDNFKAGRVA